MLPAPATAEEADEMGGTAGIAAPRYQFKVLTIGDSGVGKSSLIHRFTKSAFEPHSLPTVGIDYRVKTISMPPSSSSNIINNKHLVRLSLWDTAGQERFRTITKSYFRGSHGMLLVYDVTDRGSFFNCEQWIESVERSEARDCAVFLVANKSDCSSHHGESHRRLVSEEEGQQLADQFGVPFYQTSARTGQGVDEIFYQLARAMEVKQELRALTEAEEFRQQQRRGTSASSSCTSNKGAVAAAVRLLPPTAASSSSSRACC